MIEKVAKGTFTGLYALIDMKQIFREIKPNYKLNSKQKEKIRDYIERLKQSVDIIERS